MIWPFTTFRRLEALSTNYAKQIGNLSSELRDAQAREQLLLERCANQEVSLREANSKLAESRLSASALQSALDKANVESTKRGQVINALTAERDSLLDTNAKLIGQVAKANSDLDDAGKVIVDLHEKLKAVEKTLDQSTKNDSPKDTKTGRFTKKAVAP